MPTPIAGTVSYAASIQAIDANARVGRGCVNATGTVAYYPCRQGSGRIFRLDVAAGTFTSLYGAGWAGFAMTSLELSADETTLYIGRSSGTAGVYTAAADGSSGSPTLAVDLTGTAPSRMWRDPVTGFLFVFDSTTRRLIYTVPGTWAAAANYWFPPGSIFVGAIGPARYDPTNRLLWATTTSNTPYLLEYWRSRGNGRALVGDGTTSAAATGSQYAVPAGNITAIDSDSDGRIYWGEGSAVRMLDGTTVSQILGSNYNLAGGLHYLPNQNCLLVCNGVFEVRKVV